MQAIRKLRLCVLASMKTIFKDLLKGSYTMKYLQLIYLIPYKLLKKVILHYYHLVGLNYFKFKTQAEQPRSFCRQGYRIDSDTGQDSWRHTVITHSPIKHIPTKTLILPEEIFYSRRNESLGPLWGFTVFTASSPSFLYLSSFSFGDLHAVVRNNAERARVGFIHFLQW